MALLNMNIFEILVLGVIIAGSLWWIISYITYPFKKKNSPCGNCPYAGSCDKKK